MAYAADIIKILSSEFIVFSDIAYEIYTLHRVCEHFCSIEAIGIIYRKYSTHHISYYGSTPIHIFL